MSTTLWLGKTGKQKSTQTTEAISNQCSENKSSRNIQVALPAGMRASGLQSALLLSIDKDNLPRMHTLAGLRSLKMSVTFVTLTGASGQQAYLPWCALIVLLLKWKTWLERGSCPGWQVYQHVEYPCLSCNFKGRDGGGLLDLGQHTDTLLSRSVGNISLAYHPLIKPNATHGVFTSINT